MLDALADASPQSDVILIHASASELVRILATGPGTNLRPLLFCNDMAEGLTDAYGAIKVIVQRGHWLVLRPGGVCFRTLGSKPMKSLAAWPTVPTISWGAAQHRSLRLDQNPPTAIPAPNFRSWRQDCCDAPGCKPGRHRVRPPGVTGGSLALSCRPRH